MSSGTDGDEVVVEIETVLREERGDSGKAFVEVDSDDMAHVEENGAQYS